MNTEMDIRNFVGKCEELPQWWKDSVDAMAPDARQRLLERLMEMKKDKEQLEKEEEDEWGFEPTLWDFAHQRFPMKKWDNTDMLLSRYPTDEEKAKVIHSGQTIRLPVRWGYDDTVYETHTIPQKEWDAGERWTIGYFWTRACRVYSKNKMKAAKEMGDHQFYEGFDDDGTMRCGS